MEGARVDGQRFDDATRLLGAGASRRSVIKRMAGALMGLGAAGVAGRRASAGACLGEGSSCNAEADACCAADGLSCIDSTCQLACVESGADCGGKSGAVCCTGLVCADNNTCVEPPPTCIEAGESCLLAGVTIGCCEGLVCGEGGLCVAACQAEGDPCKAPSDCCDGLVCGAENTCEVVEVCAAEGDACSADSDCCAGICCGGACRDIACCIDDEDPNARCPEGTACFEGVCDPVEQTCGVEGDACADSADCCNDLTCADSVCAVVVTETPEETGGVTTLPTTGTGGDAGGTGALGLGLAAGAAALLAGKRLRRDAVSERE